MRSQKPFPALPEVVDAIASLAVEPYRGASKFDNIRLFSVDGEAVTKAGGWPRTWWLSFKDMLNENRFLVSTVISSTLPESVRLDSASNRYAWFIVVGPKLMQPGTFEIEDGKRFYLPGASFGTSCPGCKEKIVHDFGEAYLSYPKANAPIDVRLYCAGCGHEWSVKMRLNVTLSLEEVR